MIAAAPWALRREAGRGFEHSRPLIRDLDKSGNALLPASRKPASTTAVHRSPPQPTAVQLGPGSRRIPPFDCGDEKGAIFKLHPVPIHCAPARDLFLLIRPRLAPVSHLLTARRPSASALSTPTALTASKLQSVPAAKCVPCSTASTRPQPCRPPMATRAARRLATTPATL